MESIGAGFGIAVVFIVIALVIVGTLLMFLISLFPNFLQRSSSKQAPTEAARKADSAG
ncbi:hypothetical protein G4X40_10425 [Rhodococcus sp. D2-41]|uniref:Uncharacterized protein n=1 Tax=Speluncibacter jeojiensis TaxID=2710754 RepID=A0A9X4M4I4_9ACTN|nr:hypothetical protein [Rhodococcus sp. D2-41]MDG3010563.1 hypothetical protein [Rhodococcus sp. D2-41]MDG3014311.1 hypothetical protein [Corynebacteriales bacterium D3-21]